MGQLRTTNKRRKRAIVAANAKRVVEVPAVPAPAKTAKGKVKS